jgi:hypothetical protein
MTKKTSQLYTAVLEKLRTLVPSFFPDSVMADFEEASVAAFKKVFGVTVSVSGCWFHFSQAMMKYEQGISMSVSMY